MTDETGVQTFVNRPFDKAPARKSQTGNIQTQLSKLGNTPFDPGRIDIKMEEDYFVPSSLLSEMKREAVEKLILCRRAHYSRETVATDRYSHAADYPEKKVTYLENVSNSKARSFYYAHGATSVDEAFELAPRDRTPLMYTKHCLRYTLGYCPVYQKKESPYREPYYLVYKEMKLELMFDCGKCHMIVLKAEE